MGDQVRYREVIQGVFYEGRDSAWVEAKMANDKQRRGNSKVPDISKPIPTDALAALKEMKERFGKQPPTTD
jgi:hypothetical protein